MGRGSWGRGRWLKGPVGRWGRRGDSHDSLEEWGRGELRGRVMSRSRDPVRCMGEERENRKRQRDSSSGP